MEANLDLIFSRPFSSKIWEWVLQSAALDKPNYFTVSIVWSSLSASSRKLAKTGLAALFFFNVILAIWKAKNAKFFRDLDLSLQATISVIQKESSFYLSRIVDFFHSSAFSSLISALSMYFFRVVSPFSWTLWQSSYKCEAGNALILLIFFLKNQ